MRPVLGVEEDPAVWLAERFLPVSGGLALGFALAVLLLRGRVFALVTAGF